MSSTVNFLDSDPSIFEKNLKFVKNEVEEELEQIFGGSGGGEGKSQSSKINSASADYKIVKPTPGMCIKCFKVNTNEKFFVNLCQTDGILPPEDITENELHEILRSEKPSSYRIPMSISEPRITKDKSGNNVDCCDIAINPKFFRKCEEILIFRDFLIAIILEALSEKYNIQVSADNWIILKNRKLMGTLVAHRIQNRDIKRVYDSYTKDSSTQMAVKNNKKFMNEIINESGTASSKVNNRKKLIEEISSQDLKKLLPKKTDGITKCNENANLLNKIALIPQYRFYGITAAKEESSSKVTEIIAEFFVPECASINEMNLDIGEDRIYLKLIKTGHIFDKFIPYSNIDRNRVTATFNQTKKILKVRMPLILTKEK